MASEFHHTSHPIWLLKLCVFHNSGQLHRYLHDFECNLLIFAAEVYNLVELADPALFD